MNDVNEETSGTLARPALIDAVLACSEAPDWAQAQSEWETIGRDYDPQGGGECHCGQEHLKRLFTVRNTINGAVLHPIGSTCIREHFESPAMAAQLRVQQDLLDLEVAVGRGEALQLKKHLTRSRLASLRTVGAIDADQHDLLRTVFGRRTQSTPAEWRAVDEVLRTVVTPFLGGAAVAERSATIEAMVAETGAARLRTWLRYSYPDVLGLDEYALDVLGRRGVLDGHESRFMHDMLRRASLGWRISPKQHSWMESLVRRAGDYAQVLAQAGDAA